MVFLRRSCEELGYNSDVARWVFSGRGNYRSSSFCLLRWRQAKEIEVDYADLTSVNYCHLDIKLPAHGYSGHCCFGICNVRNITEKISKASHRCCRWAVRIVHHFYCGDKPI